MHFRVWPMARPMAPPHPGLVAYPTVGPDWADRLAAVASSERRDGNAPACWPAPGLSSLRSTGTRSCRHPPLVLSPVSARRGAGRGHGRGPRRKPGQAAVPIVTGGAGRSGLASGDPRDALSDDDLAALDALTGWAAGFRSLADFLNALERARARLAMLRDTEAPVELITVHAAKGREWATVIVIGFEEERFPNRRALLAAADQARAVEEERRLAYVAMTRATERLVLAFDPARPSRFLADAGLLAASA